jgi:hypothetical protein
MNTLISFAIHQAHNPDSPMEDEVRHKWFLIEKKIKDSKEKQDLCDGYLTELANCSQKI